MRINAYLSRAGVASRRKADEIIKAGRVNINGQPANLSSQATENDRVTVDGKPISLTSLSYILLNKPAGYITSTHDPEGRPTVMELVGKDKNVVPVGRLDFYTSGLLLLTNDGELANQLMHPKFELNKTYQVKVDQAVTDEILNKLRNGINLEDGKTAPAQALKTSNNSFQITIHEGRNRQIRRMVAALGLRLSKLHRSNYGSLELGSLKEGSWRFLTDAEVSSLKRKMVQ